MKKLIYCGAALATALFAGSCQRELLDPAAQGNTVTYTVNMPEVATKAGESNLLVDKLVYAVYRVKDSKTDREAALANLSGTCEFVYQYEQDVTGTRNIVSLELINNQKYVVAFWAQTDDKWFDHDNKTTDHKGTTDYQFAVRGIDLTIYEPNTLEFDAFSGVDFIDVNDSPSKSIELKRPFAQLNIATNLPETFTAGVKKTTLTVHNVAKSYNVVTNVATVDDETPLVFKATAPLSTEYPSYDKYISMNYVFVPEDRVSVTVSYEIETEAHGTVTNTIDYVPLARNYKTNIVGNLLTSKFDYTVNILNNWSTPSEEIVLVNTASGLQDAVNNAVPGVETEIKLDGDIDLNDLAALLATPGTLSTKAGTEPKNYGIAIPADRTIVLDLNGNTLAQTVSQEGAYSMIENKGNLTIIDSKGTGKIAYGDTGNGGEYVSNTICNSGTLVIENGLIENNSSATVAANGYPHPIDNSGELIINGGTLTNNAHYSSMRIWCTTDDDTSVTINGGTFNGSIDFQTPSAAANKGTLTINGGTFNADTYTNSAVRLLGFGADVDEMFGYIKGGTFNGSVKINKYGSVQELNSQVFYISGGIFSDDPTEFLATGYATEQDAEGKWIIKECPVKIGDAEYYATLAEAVAAVKEGETITILAGKTLEEGTIKLPASLKNVTIKGGDKCLLKDMTISAADGNSVNYEGLTFDGITFENSNVVLTGWRTSGVVYKDITVTNCTFRNVTRTNNEAAFHINCDATEAVNGFIFTNNVIDGVSGASNSGLYAQLTGEVLISGNVINNVAFRPYVIQITNDDGVEDEFVVTRNTFSGSSKGRAQGLGNNAAGTDQVNLVVTENIFKGITDSQQICYWNFNSAKTTADLSHNYYDIDILANPGKIYFNNSAANVYDLVDMGVFPIYTDENKTTTFSPEVSAAKIGETEYATLQEAFNAGGEITLLHNITVDETVVLSEDVTVVLDLNGKTLAAADMNVVKNNGGNLTIKNGTITRTGDVVGYSVNNASGEIVVENATVQRGLYTSGSKLTATNANISHEQSSRHAIYAWNCEVTINSGTFHNDNAGNATLMASGSSVVTINGGTFSIADGRSSLGWTSSMIDQNSTAQVLVKGGLFNGGFRINSADTKLTIEGGEFNTNNGSAFTDYSGTKVVKGGKFTDAGAQNWAKKYLADGYILAGDEVKKAYVVNDAASLIETITNAEADAYIVVENALECTETVSLPANSTLALNADVIFTTLKAVSGATITIQDGKTLTLNNFSFGSKDAAGAEYEIKGGTVTANYGFFQHGKYSLYSNFETGYMYYSYGSDITVYGTFHSQGKGDGLDYVRGKLTIAKGGKSIHDKSLWVGQPASWGAMNASLVIEEGGYVQANSLSVYEGSSLTYSNDADLKYNSVTGTEYITKK